DQALTLPDPLRDSLTFTKACGRSFLTVTTTNATTGNIHLAPASGNAGTYPASVSASDGSLSDVKTFSVIVASVGPGPNLVTNPSFETNTTGWASYTTGTSIQRVPGGFDGSYSLEVTGPATGTAKFGVNDSPNWVSSTSAVGTVYRFTAWVRSTTGATGKAQLQVREWVGSTRQGLITPSPSVTLAPGWQMVTVDRVVTTAGSTLDLQVLDGPIVAGEVFRTDNISIRVVPGGSPAPAGPQHTASSSPRALAAFMAPNPLNPDATLAFSTTQEGSIRVRVYDTAGRYVRTLVEGGSVPAGYHAIRFDGRDASGRRLASGVYFYLLEAKEGSVRGRFVVRR